MQAPNHHERCRPAYGWVGAHQPGEDSRAGSRARSPPSRRVGKVAHPSSVGFCLITLAGSSTAHRMCRSGTSRLSCRDPRCWRAEFTLRCGQLRQTVEPKVGKRGVAMATQTQEATIEAVHPPFVVATVDLGPSTTNNLEVSVKGLGRKNVGEFRQAFLQLRQTRAGALPDNFTILLIQVGDESLVFRIRRIDTANNVGWGQNLQVQILLIGETKDKE